MELTQCVTSLYYKFHIKYLSNELLCRRIFTKLMSLWSLYLGEGRAQDWERIGLWKGIAIFLCYFFIEEE